MVVQAWFVLLCRLTISLSYVCNHEEMNDAARLAIAFGMALVIVALILLITVWCMDRRTLRQWQDINRAREEFNNRAREEFDDNNKDIPMHTINIDPVQQTLQLVTSPSEVFVVLPPVE